MPWTPLPAPASWSAKLASSRNSSSVHARRIASERGWVRPRTPASVLSPPPTCHGALLSLSLPTQHGAITYAAPQRRAWACA
eukprot:scaffold45453_cov63-Phaeocystis_antarctica.AAC.3